LQSALFDYRVSTLGLYKSGHKTIAVTTRRAGSGGRGVRTHDVRREYEVGVAVVLRVARKRGVHCRTLRQALANGDRPSPSASGQGANRRLRAPLIPFSGAILEGHRKALH